MKEIWCVAWTKDIIQNLTKDEWYDFYKNKLHRLDGPAYEEVNGSKVWYVDGKRHRLDRPAVEWYDGTKEWFVHGKRHRLDGPAIEWRDGTKEWWIDENWLNIKEVEFWLKENDVDLKEPENQMAFKLRFA